MPDSPTPEQLERRAELLAHCGPDDAAELAELTETLRQALRGEQLRVRRLSADRDGAMIDRLAAAEPVHPFRGPDDVADRLADDRRCFVLEHPSLADRPLNVVWVALWQGVPHDLAAVLDPTAPTGDPTAADTAAFYSIWNVEPGLVGLPGGRTLLIGAMAALRAELAGLSTFVTLSPIPGLRRWLEADAVTPAPHDDGSPSEEEPLSEGELLRAGARYLTSLRDDGRPLDAVARFHLGNGARLLSICAGADRSERGMDRSFGLMANYRYEPEDRDANRAALAAGEVAVGEQVAALLD
jgi:malonyl-CoA decarboxylase